MTAEPPDRALTAHAAMLLYSFLIASSFPVGAAVVPYLDPLVVTFLRYCLAASAFLVLIWLRRAWRPPRPAALLGYGAISLAMTVFFVTMFKALETTPALSTGALFTLVPLLSAGIAWLLLRQACTPRQLGFLCLGGLGALWVLFEGDVARLLALELAPGLFIFAIGCVTFSAYAPLVRLLHRGEPLILLSFWTTALGAGMLGLYAAEEIRTSDFRAVPLAAWLGLIHLALSNTGLTFLLAQFASLRLPAHKVMAYTYLTPTFVALQLSLIGQGWPSLSVTLGIALTAAATLLLQRSESR